jgi:lipoate-protein ligase A
MTSWQLIESPNLSGPQNMEYDLKLFHDFEKGLVPSTLRIYSWKPNCISLGYSQKMDRWIDGKMARKLGWDVVKRPTGGGIVFHNEAEVTYSLVTAIDNPILPEGLVPSYTKISKKPQIPNSKSETRLCFSYPAEYEIVYNGKKIVGSAQKRGKRTLLQQGSVFVRIVNNEAYSILKEPYQKENAVSIEEILNRKVSFEELSRALVEGFEEGLGVKIKNQISNIKNT